MLKNDFIKVACITPVLEVGNPLYNIKEVLKSLIDNKAAISVYPELCISGYTCGDLFYQATLLNDVNEAISYFLENNQYKGIVVLGAPIEKEGSLFNCAIVIKGKTILGIVPKKSLPNSNEFFEKRYFKSGKNINSLSCYFLGQTYPFGDIIFHDEESNLHFGVEICEDMWNNITPGSILSSQGANMILNLSASNDFLGKDNIRRITVLDNSRRNSGAYIYTSAGINESTSDSVFSGHNIICANGRLIKEIVEFNINTNIIYADIDLGEINYKRRHNTNMHELFAYKIQNVYFSLERSKEYYFEKKFDETPFVPKSNIIESFNKIANILEYALLKRMKHTKSKTLIIGISGGLDSTLALLVAIKTFKLLNIDLKNIIAVTMPGLGTTDRTKNNAMILMKKLGVTILVKPITDSIKEHFKLIDHDETIKDVTYENAQARMRTLILMNLANKYQGFVLGTGDMSELALGWCTYNGDQMSMYGINSGLPKTLVRFMVREYALREFTEIKDILLDIIETPISPELISNQSTEDTLGKYEINDFILYRYLTCGDSEERIEYLLNLTFNISSEICKNYVNSFFFRFFSQQFKRQALPDGPKVLDVSLNPRSGYRLPCDIKRWKN